MRFWGDNLKLSCIATVPKEHHRPRLILNLLLQPNEGMTSINDTIDREFAPESMQFGRAFPRILQAIWEIDPYKVPVRMSKLGRTDAYHRGMLRPYQVGYFAYAIPSAADDDCVIICIDLVLSMGWVVSPNFFCALS